MPFGGGLNIMSENAESAQKFNYLYGLINFAVVFCIVWFLWYIFMNPDAVMKLYTPMYGFALIAVFLSSIVLMNDVVGYYPFGESSLAKLGVIPRGIVLTVVSVVLMLVLNYIVFWNIIGEFGIAYFSPSAIVASGGTGAEPFVARENASTAILYYSTAFLWVAMFWKVAANETR